MKKVLYALLALTGWLLIIGALMIIAIGTYSGVTEDRAFYERRDAYYALEPQRDSIIAVIDSMQTVRDELQHSDSVAAKALTMQIDSIHASDYYNLLFGPVAPPIGFSLAGLVSVIAFLMALVPLILGIVLLIVRRRLKHKQTEPLKGTSKN